VGEGAKRTLIVIKILNSTSAENLLAGDVLRTHVSPIRSSSFVHPLLRASLAEASLKKRDIIRVKDYGGIGAK
jgi:hypothetical protein